MLTQQEMQILREQAAAIVTGDMFAPHLRRHLKKVNDQGTVYEVFYREGTEAAVVVAMLEAIERGLPPVIMACVGEVPDPKRETGGVVYTDTDTATDAALAAAGPAEKPDFNALKRVPGMCSFEVGQRIQEQHEIAMGFPAINSDIAEQEDALLGPDNRRMTQAIDPGSASKATPPQPPVEPAKSEKAKKENKKKPKEEPKPTVNIEDDLKTE